MSIYKIYKSIEDFVSNRSASSVEPPKENDYVSLKVGDIVECVVCNQKHTVYDLDSYYPPHGHIAKEIIYKDGVIYLKELHGRDLNKFYALVPLNNLKNRPALVKFCELWFQNKTDFEFDVSKAEPDFTGSTLIHKPSGVGFVYQPRCNIKVQGISEYENLLLQDWFLYNINEVFNFIFAQHVTENKTQLREIKNKIVEEANKNILERLSK